MLEHCIGCTVAQADALSATLTVNDAAALFRDVQENIESARRFGWQAIHWTGEIALDAALAPFAARK